VVSRENRHFLLTGAAFLIRLTALAGRERLVDLEKNRGIDPYADLPAIVKKASPFLPTPVLARGL